MQPGPELDALVAEHVMGWHRRNEFDQWQGQYNMPKARYDWSPSTDWGAAGMVVDKLMTIDGIDGVNIHSPTVHHPWQVEIVKGIYADYGRADTPQLAICIAALKAVGVEVPSPQSTPVLDAPPQADR